MSEFVPFSKKQLDVLTWWHPKSGRRGYDAVICDGSVRSGKTVCMSISFVAWSIFYFNSQSFAFCGKTLTTLRRNVISPTLASLRKMGFVCDEKISKSYIDITYNGRKNRYYLFGGKDEGSAALVQGITLAGVMFDEVALMPRSFVEQALARCSVSGSKFWFNCNPENPYHWFYREWIKNAESKKALYIHFTMRDNPSLSPEILKRYETLYTGTFYERFVLGRWVAAQGLVYPMFDYNANTAVENPKCERFYISCDYGTVNPASFGLWGSCGDVWYRLKEYYYSSRREGAQKTDEEYYAELERLADGCKIEAVVIDPSAASFIECIRRHGKFTVIPAKNDVLSGIRRVSDALRNKKILFHESCKDCIREFALYSWDCKGSDNPQKENDHAMDDVRYFVAYAMEKENDGFFVASLKR